LNILIWARENGCPWDEDTFINAIRGKSVLVINWLRENGCPEPIEVKEEYDDEDDDDY